MLGVFDSGFGGLTVLKPIHNLLPDLSTIYLGDNARAPYGVRTQEEIFQFALEGVRWLFAQGCPLVILACNTASVQALRRIQQTVLPVEFPDRRVLGVVRPAAEYLTKHATRIGMFATRATVASDAYAHELVNLNPTIQLAQVACPGLTDLIELGRHDSDEADALIRQYTRDLLAQDPIVQEVLLACTHYPLVERAFRAHLPAGVRVFSQGEIVATSLEAYLARHPDLDARLDRIGARSYFTTGDDDVSRLASMFYGEDIRFDQVEIAC